MKSYQRLTIFILATILLSAITGCGTGSDKGKVLAEVGNDVIYEKDMEDIIKREARNFRTYDDELKYRKDLLDSMIVQRLLIKAAYDRKIDEVEEVSRLVLGNQNKFLLDVLYQREIEDKAKASDDEVRDWYNKMEYKYKVSHILAATEDTAQIILDSLRNGGNFEDLAVNFSKDPSAIRNRGELDYFAYGQMVPEFQEQVLKMAPGEITTPFRTRYGWHIVRLQDKIPNAERRSYEAMEESIKDAILKNKKGALMEAFNDSLKASFPIAIDTGTVAYLMHKREILYPPHILKNLPRNDYDLDQLDRNDKELILANWKGGQITVGEYLSEVPKLKNYITPPDLDNYDSLASIIFQLNVMELLAAEARRQGLENDPLYEERLKDFRELAMADIMKNDSLALPDAPDEGEMRQYYEDNIDEFREAPSIDAYEIMINSKEKALKYRREIKSLSKFREIAAVETERPGKREEKGALGYITERSWGRFYKAADSTPVGGITNPIEMANGMYSIIYVQDKKGESIKPFNQVMGQINTTLLKERRDKVFAEWVEKKKGEVSITINENNLRASIDKNKYAGAEEAPQG